MGQKKREQVCGGPHGWPVGQGRGGEGLARVNAEGGEENGKLYSKEAEALGRRLGTWGP